MTEWKTHKVHNIDVFYLPTWDGGGSTFGRQFLPLLQHVIKPVSEAFEWCCGPAFIGFSLLAQGYCQNLFLSDANPLVKEAIRRTVRNNRLGSAVKFYVSDTIRGLPNSQKWDLVVANPPHFNQCIGNPLTDDLQWNTHIEFFKSINSRLRPNADVFLQENFMGATPEKIVELADGSNLTLHNIFVAKSPDTRSSNVYYFLHFKPKNDLVRLITETPRIISAAVTNKRRVRVLTVQADHLLRLQVDNQSSSPLEINLFAKERMRLIKTYNIRQKSKVITHPFSVGVGEYSLMDCLSHRKLWTIYAK